MLSGFKDFIMRGNVIELAVAVVIGSAFAAVVDTIVSSIITPLLNAAGGAEVGGLKFEIINGRADTAMDFAAIINALIVFLLTAGVATGFQSPGVADALGDLLGVSPAAVNLGGLAVGLVLAGVAAAVGWRNAVGAFDDYTAEN